ncbi:8973_t:CDS:2 [Paraglomus occultum]|uniref:8973_t:CDS:1 n=1 Tax=Paraglomus occultum TaxID=144539 RepID=A0A9N9C4U0_9GLOM|nr:8973_t:CDS:2 [Paraglomus occultum]
MIKNNKLVADKIIKELKESQGSKSETRNIQIVEFKYEREEYQIVDSIGIGDTSLSDSQVLAEITKGYELIKNGIHQVLFVVGGRFTPEEVETFNLLKKFFFDVDVDKYTTIVRTRFPNFEDESERNKDIETLRDENNPKITKMLDSCNEIVHVDNPSVNVVGDSLRVKKQVELNKETHLKKIKEDFKDRVKKENKKFEEEIKNLRKKKDEDLKKEIESLEKKIEENKKLENIDAFEALIEIAASKSGSGKSALANVITGTKRFGEADYAAS